MANHKYGCIRDTHDPRDLIQSATLPEHVAMFARNIGVKLGLTAPKTVDLRSKFTEVFDQGQIGSCTGNGISALLAFVYAMEKLKVFIPSRLFIYYNEREIEHTVNSDDGAQIRDGIKSVAKQGVCDEVKWPYVENKFKIKPPIACYNEASQHVAIQYYRIDNKSLNSMKACLDANACIVFGITLYESFEKGDWTETTCMMPFPNVKNEEEVGGHCMVVVGYSDIKKAFLVRNSWGKDWCKKEGGYFWLPYSIMTSDMVSDCWTITVAK